MKKVAIITTILLAIIFTLGYSKVFAANTVIDNKTESQLIEIKDNVEKSLEDYKQKYGSDTYGIAAFVLNQVRIFSIPVCFLGIAISAIYRYVIGIRRLDTQEKGFAFMISSITILVICQILPLAFAIVVKFGRG